MKIQLSYAYDSDQGNWYMTPHLIVHFRECNDGGWRYTVNSVRFRGMVERCIAERSALAEEW